MPDFIGISSKQTPWLKFDFLKIVAGRGQKNIGTAMFSSPKKIVCSTYKHQMFARLIKKVQCYFKSSSFKLKMGVFMMKKGWSLASSLKSSLLMPSGFIDSKPCWNSMSWTCVFHGQPVGFLVTKNRFFLFYFHHYCRYLNQSWFAHSYNTVILAGQVSREIIQGKLLNP